MSFVADAAHTEATLLMADGSTRLRSYATQITSLLDNVVG